MNPISAPQSLAINSSLTTSPLKPNSVIPMLILLPRSRLIPDFAFTIHFLHLLTTTLYTHSIPTNLLWWTLQTGSSALMIALGIWGARYRELRPITFGINPTSDSSNHNNKKTSPSSSTSRGNNTHQEAGPSSSFSQTRNRHQDEEFGEIEETEGEEQQPFLHSQTSKTTRMGRGRGRRDGGGTPAFLNLPSSKRNKSKGKGHNDEDLERGSYEMVERGDGGDGGDKGG